MFYENKENGVMITSIRIDNETKKNIELVRSHIKAINDAVFTSDNSVAKKALNLYIRKYELEYLLNNKINQKEVDILDDIIIKRDPSWKEKRDRIDEHISMDIKNSMREFGNYLQEKEEFDHKPTYNELVSYLLNNYSKNDKDFINPIVKTKYIIRREKIRRMKNEQQGIYNT